MRIPYPQILNEKSFSECPSREVFAERMRALKGVMARMHEIGFAFVAVKSRSIYGRHCVGNMSFREWLFSRGTSPEERTLKEFFRTVMSKTPDFEELPDEYVGTCDFDLLFGGQRLYPNPNGEIPAFLVSFKNALPSVVLDVGEFSGKRIVSIEIHEMDELCDLLFREESLPVVSDVLGAESFRGQSVGRIVQELDSGHSILNAKKDLWPNMSFSDEALEQLERFDARIDLLVGVQIKLYSAFTRCVESGTRDLQREYGSRKSLVMSESETVQNQFAETRRFHWPDCSRLCFPHIRLNLQYRIHFLPDYVSRKLFVGYIGPHLPTGKYS